MIQFLANKTHTVNLLFLSNKTPTSMIYFMLKTYSRCLGSFLDNLMEQPEMFFPKKQDSSVAFVCHANLIRYFISRYFLLDRAQWQNLWLGNCSISTLKFHDKSNVELDLLAFEEHIPRHL